MFRFSKGTIPIWISILETWCAFREDRYAAYVDFFGRGNSQCHLISFGSSLVCLKKMNIETNSAFITEQKLRYFC
ncbi:MAG TPA: hypothetical protein DCQ83_04370 [Fibrobacteres bacterium]|nr:hypothetical protein [Fibrobacterota bacterium]